MVADILAILAHAISLLLGGALFVAIFVGGFGVFVFLLVVVRLLFFERGRQ
jgi:hypothetical protein